MKRKRGRPKGTTKTAKKMKEALLKQKEAMKKFEVKVATEQVGEGKKQKSEGEKVFFWPAGILPGVMVVERAPSSSSREGKTHVTSKMDV